MTKFKLTYAGVSIGALQRETELVFAYPEAVIGRTYRTRREGAQSVFKVCRMGHSSGTVYVEGKRRFTVNGKPFDEHFGGAYPPLLIGVRWHDAEKMPTGFKARTILSDRNSAAAWLLSFGREPKSLRGFSVGPLLCYGYTVIPSGGVPVYPHELGAGADDDTVRLFRKAVRAEQDPHSPPFTLPFDLFSGSADSPSRKIVVRRATPSAPAIKVRLGKGGRP